MTKTAVGIVSASTCRRLLASQNCDTFHANQSPDRPEACLNIKSETFGLTNLCTTGSGEY